MQSITSNHGVHVHAEMHELDRIRQQLTASQLSLWGDHSSRIAAMFGLSNNEIADVLFNDCGLVVWAVENPELGAAIALGLSAVWSQLANLNALCNLVETKYEVGELTIDRKIGLEHQLLEFAATAPFWAKLGLLPAEPTGGLGVGKGSGKAPAPIIVPPTNCLPPVPVEPPVVVRPPVVIHPPTVGLPPRPVSGPGRGELQDSENLQGSASYKSNYAQN